MLTLITGEKSVFDRRDVARTLHRYINDDPSEYQALYSKVMASDELVRISDGPDGVRYSTREMVELETGMARDVAAMSARSKHGVRDGHVDRAIDGQDEAIRRSIAVGLPDDLAADQRARLTQAAGMSEEQRDAVRHITGDQQVSVVVGFAGAGKSTMLAAARDAWEAEGYTVHGAALAGKAVAGLEESAGIEGRTLASWEMRWKMGTAQLGPRDVMVIDEAGMVGSRQLAKFVSEAERTGAKLVLVGDHEQLQAIGAGAPFRAVAEEVGYASVEDIRRQRIDWQKEASRAFATERTEEGLSAYEKRGHVHLKADQDAARAGLVADYVDDIEARPDGTRAAMAHRRVDVRDLNEDIRASLKGRGHLQGEEVAYKTENGERSFTAGDRIVFLQNNRDMNVKNGTLGTVEAVEHGRIITRVDGSNRAVAIDATDYKTFDHGYATTIHKTQGATVDRSYVLASETMDRHMTYVAMTRHKDAATLYAGEDQFADMEALKTRLGRSGAKETVLDYVDRDGRRRDTGQQVRDTEAFARRRGMDSDIVYPAGRQPSGQVHAREVEPDRSNEPAQPTKKRSMFAGLKLKADASERDNDRSRDAAIVDRSGRRGTSSLEKATDRYARAYSDAARMKLEGLPILEGQKQALNEAQRSLDQTQPGASGVMESALRHNPAMRQAMMDLSGEARTKTLIMGMSQEHQALADPHVRAQRFVERWNSLSARQQSLQGWQYDEARAPVEKAMRDMAKEIARDPQAESLLRNRRQELGLGKAGGQDSISRELERSIQRDRDRDRGLGL